MNIINTIGKNAADAAFILSTAGSDIKNAALHAMASALRAHSDEICTANALDLAAGKENGLSSAMLERLTLTPERVNAMADGIIAVALQADPIGEVLSGGVRPNGMRITEVRVPLGVVGIIYESRPNVTSDSAALCLKAGNACILRGGKEAIKSNLCIASVLREAVGSVGLPADCIQMISDTSRTTATAMMKLNGYIDVLIPRGGAGLIKTVVKEATVPVIETGIGNCHLYIDEFADIDMAVNIAENAKLSRPSVCNAIETLLVHKAVADKTLPLIAERYKAKTVQIYGCEATVAILGDSVLPATDAEYETEFNDFTIAIKVIENFDEAISHITRFSSKHSECIVTENFENAERFLNQIDAAAVYVNVSTRYTDGGEFGLGAEIGISTQKLHARGPMGIKALTSNKFIIRGNGQVR